MMLHRFIIDWMTAYTTTGGGTEVAIPAGPWERINPAATRARGWGELRGELGQVNVGFGFQHCNDVQGSITSVRCSGLLSADGVNDPTGTPTTIDIDGSKYIRACIFLTSVDGNIAGGGMSGVVELWAA